MEGRARERSCWNNEIQALRTAVAVTDLRRRVEAMLKFRRPIPRQARETCVALGHLFSNAFAGQLNAVLCPNVRTSDGYATVWMPKIEFAITSMKSSSPVFALERRGLSACANASSKKFAAIGQ